MACHARLMELPISRLLAWFEENRRCFPWRDKRTIYRIWVSEVMLQQTQAVTVMRYFPAFLKRFPTVNALAGASRQEVLKAWEGLGYYSRARHLHRAARIVDERFQGRIPKDIGHFRSLPGVGEYIAAAVMSLSCGLAVPVVDGNVLRVTCRFAGIASDIRQASTRRKVTAALQSIIPTENPGRFNEALMELGALVCRSRDPRCPVCPLAAACFARRRGRTGVLPQKSRRPPVPLYRVAVAVITRSGRIFIQQRPEEGHLGGLWEFPGGKIRKGENPQTALRRECREELGIELRIQDEIAVVDHVYSHFKIRLHAFICRIASGSLKSAPPGRWISVDQLGDFPFPAANHKFFPALRAWLSR